jgi:transcriptional regulator
VFSPELKKGSLDLLILSVLEERPMHGYLIGQRIEDRSRGRIEFRISTLYQVLYRMERNGWISGRWVEKKGERRRCTYRLTAEGRRVLARKLEKWEEFTATVNEVIGLSNA